MNKNFIVLLLLLCFFLTGCGASRMLLNKKQKELKLKPNEGGVIFSLHVESENHFKPTTVVIQEVNQYKEYGKKKIESIQLKQYGTHDDTYLLNLKLPKGTYKLASLWGLLGGFWASAFEIPCNRVFDVLPGEIHYAGRMEVKIVPQGNLHLTPLAITNFYEEDTSVFTGIYPVLQGKRVDKDLIY